MSRRLPGKLSFNDPITLQLLKNSLFEHYTLKFESLIFILKIHIGEEISKEQVIFLLIKLLQENIDGKKHETLSPAVKVMIESGVIKMNLNQIKVFFVYLRSFIEYLATVSITTDSKEIDSEFYLSSIKGIMSATSNLANKYPEKNKLRLGNTVEKWLKIALSTVIKIEDATGKPLPMIRFTTTGIQSLVVIIQEIEADALDVIAKLEDSVNFGNPCMYAVDRAQLILCQLAQQIQEIVQTGLQHHGIIRTASEAQRFHIALFLNSFHFSNVLNSKK